MRAALECRLHCLIYILRLSLLVTRACRNVDIDSGPDLHAWRHAGDRSASLAQHVVCRETLQRDAIKRLLAVLLDTVGEVEGLFRRQIGEKRPADVAYV